MATVRLFTHPVTKMLIAEFFGPVRARRELAASAAIA